MLPCLWYHCYICKFLKYSIYNIVTSAFSASAKIPQMQHVEKVLLPEALIYFSTQIAISVFGVVIFKQNFHFADRLFD